MLEQYLKRQLIAFRFHLDEHERAREAAISNEPALCVCMPFLIFSFISAYGLDNLLSDAGRNVYIFFRGLELW